MQKIGDFYGACMDEQKANDLGAKPLQPELDAIDKIASRQDLIKTIAHLQSIGVSALFRFGPETDMHNSTMTIAGVNQGGLSLPDRDYYLKEDAKSVETRQKYVEHVGRMFELLGDKPETASARSQNGDEHRDHARQARHGSGRHAQAREPRPCHDPATTGGTGAGFEFAQYFAATGAPAITKVNVVAPEFFKQINAQLDSVPLERLEDLPALASGAFLCALALRSVCERETSDSSVTTWKASRSSRCAGSAACGSPTPGSAKPSASPTWI